MWTKVPCLKFSFDIVKTGIFDELKSQPMLNSQLDEDIVSRFSHQQVITYFNLYLKNASVIIDSMAEDIQNKDYESLRSRAHKLKGSSMVVGAGIMKELASAIEQHAKEKNKADIEKFEQLKDQFAELIHLLKIRYNISYENY